MAWCFMLDFLACAAFCLLVLWCFCFVSGWLHMVVAPYGAWCGFLVGGFGWFAIGF